MSSSTQRVEIPLEGMLERLILRCVDAALDRYERGEQQEES